MSKTDIANRAITMYEFFQASMQSGLELLVRNVITGETNVSGFSELGGKRRRGRPRRAAEG